MDRRKLPLVFAVVLSTLAVVNLIVFLATGGGLNLLLVFVWGISSIYWWATWHHSATHVTER